MSLTFTPKIAEIREWVEVSLEMWKSYSFSHSNQISSKTRTHSRILTRFRVKIELTLAFWRPGHARMREWGCFFHPRSMLHSPVFGDIVSKKKTFPENSPSVGTRPIWPPKLKRYAFFIKHGPSVPHGRRFLRVALWLPLSMRAVSGFFYFCKSHTFPFFVPVSVFFA